MKQICILLIMVSVLTLCVALKKPARDATINKGFCVQYYITTAAEFTISTKQLQQAIDNITPDGNTVKAAQRQLAACRKVYKKIEFFVAYFLENRINIFNQAPVYEIEEPYMEYQHPIGMQAMEAMLFADSAFNNKAELTAQAEVIYTTAADLKQYLYGKEITDAAILESFRLELIRIYTLGITGYDAPELKTGITEAYEAMKAVGINLQPYLDYAQNPAADSTRSYLQKSLRRLSQNTNFNTFNRAAFFIEAALPLQQYLGILVQNLQLQKESNAVLNYNVPHIFSRGSINKISVATTASNKNIIALGKKLFTENMLSGNGRRSCATCHSPARYFTDGQVTSIAFNGSTRVKRNAPSLLYSVYQHNQFLDGRAADLHTQMLTVLTSPVEMNANPATVIKKLNNDFGYQQIFKNAFPDAPPDSLVTIAHIAEAITSYEQSFTVRTAAFDRYINGDKNAMTPNQVKGFNLFMGKALCGTCHFAPLFNGLLPPEYGLTEVESLGLTASANFKKPVADTDSGRYKFFPISFYIGAFKTPSVRNAAQTAPYMHNGVFATLHQVMDFYNKGGGNGMGLNNANQTLSAKPLKLTPKEIDNIILFLGALKDKPS